MAMALPLAVLIYIAFSGQTDSPAHIYATILPSATKTTFLLLVGVATITAMIGVTTAWLAAFFDFPGRRMFDWLLALPLAVPPYLAAYAFVEFLDFTGPIQTTLRALGGHESARDYWFPDIRSLGGAVIVLSLVLYPYTYLAVRALFALQGARMLESARMLGVRQSVVLRTVLLPLVRPAVALGVGLALMETLNDIGAMEYLGVRTLTLSIFSVWLNQNDIAGAAQIALVLLAFVLFLITVERLARRSRKYFEQRTTKRHTVFVHQRLTGFRGAVACGACALPVLFGFGIPLYVLSGYAWAGGSGNFNPALTEAFITTVTFAAIAGLVTVVLAIVLAHSLRGNQNPANRGVVRLATLGYAVPGTIIALGIFIPLAAFDNLVDGWARSALGISTGLLITGSGAALVYAYAVRFVVMAEGNIDGGLNKLSPHLDMVARTLGRSRRQILFQVLLPALRPVLFTAFILVFIESAKELSATILLRPFGVTTLATYVYDYASQSRVDEVGVAALLIMLAGTLPVLVLTRAAFRS